MMIYDDNDVDDDDDGNDSNNNNNNNNNNNVLWCVCSDNLQKLTLYLWQNSILIKIGKRNEHRYMLLHASRK
jgi:hypothetical protein